jgi:hypothetical protein
MIDKQFEIFLHNFIKLHNIEVFNDIPKCKSFLLDYAKGEYKKEIRLLLQALEINFHNAIKKSNDLNITRISLINQLQSEYFISEEIAVSLIDLLLSVIKGYIPEKNEIITEKKNSKMELTPPIQPTVTHDYEKEAKAERFYQTAINCFFKDIGNRFTLAADNLLKAIKLCPEDKRFHYYLSYCFYKLNDNDSLNNEKIILKELNCDKTINTTVKKDITSTKKGKIAIRLLNAFKLGGEMQLSAAKSSIYQSSKINYAESAIIFNQYNNFINWAKSFDEEF